MSERHGAAVANYNNLLRDYRNLERLAIQRIAELERQLAEADLARQRAEAEAAYERTNAAKKILPNWQRKSRSQAEAAW